MKKLVSDLGISAWLMLHGFKVLGRKGKNVIFELDNKDLDSFEKLTMDYLQSPFHQFDHHLMILKKVYESSSDLTGKALADIGASAYLMLNGFKVTGRKGRNIYFEVHPEDNEEFAGLLLDYTNSQYSQFDSCLMALKKVGDYVSSDV